MKLWRLCQQEDKCGEFGIRRVTSVTSVSARLGGFIAYCIIEGTKDLKKKVRLGHNAAIEGSIKKPHFFLWIVDCFL